MLSQTRARMRNRSGRRKICIEPRELGISQLTDTIAKLIIKKLDLSGRLAVTFCIYISPSRVTSLRTFAGNS